VKAIWTKALRVVPQKGIPGSSAAFSSRPLTSPDPSPLDTIRNISFTINILAKASGKSGEQYLAPIHTGAASGALSRYHDRVLAIIDFDFNTKGRESRGSPRSLSRGSNCSLSPVADWELPPGDASDDGARILDDDL
jgi:hypothetical protein